MLPKNSIARLSAATALLALAAGLFPAAAADAEPVAAVTYKNVLNGRCLANWTLGGFAGTGVCGTDPWTGWTLRLHDTIFRTYLIQNTRTGGCLQRRSDGSVVSAECNHGIDAQVWSLPWDANAFIIQDGYHEGCLGASGPTGVHFYGACDGGDTHFRWR